MTTTLLIETPEGEARAHLTIPDGPRRGLLMLGHGAGGGVHVPDLAAASMAAGVLGWAVALVEQPYRVQGRRAPPTARRLDSAWIRAAAFLTQEPELRGLPLVCGGRSSGARVACRTAAATGAAGIICLAFPLQPPPQGGEDPSRPSRLGELDAVAVPVLVVQGVTDRFGMVPSGPGRIVEAVAGDHALKRDPAAVGHAVGDWLLVLRP